MSPWRHKSGHRRPFGQSAAAGAILSALLLVCAGLPAWGGDFAQALSMLEQCESLRREYAAALETDQYEAAAQAQETLRRRMREARALFESAGIQRTRDEAAVLKYAQLLDDLSEYDLAAAVLEPLVRSSPDDASILVRYGESLAAIGPARRQDAFDVLRRVLSLADEDSVWRAHAALGMLYWREGLYDFAREAFEAAHEGNPEDVRSRIALAACRCRAGEILDAARMLDALGRAAQPFDAETRIMLREALYGFDLGRQHFPDSAEQHAAYAKLLYRAGRIADAILAAQRAVRLDTDDVATWNFLAAMHIQTGNVSQARNAYEQSLKAQPDQPQIRGALEAIPPNQ